MNAPLARVPRLDSTASSAPLAPVGVNMAPIEVASSPRNLPGVENVIGANMSIKGDVTVSGELIVHGKIEGAIKGSKDSVVRIEQRSVHTGPVEASTVYVSGQVDGEIRSADLLVVTKNGIINGNVHYNNINLEPGAKIAGMLHPNYKGDAEA